MPNLVQLNTQSLYVMLKGEVGTRKSTVALTFPTPQYWVNSDQKIAWARIPMKNFGIEPTQIDYDYYQTYDPVRKKLEQLQVKCPYKTVVIDSITSAADAINNQTKQLKSGTTTTQGQEKGYRVGGITVNTLEDYKAEAAAFQEIIALTKDIHRTYNCNIVLIAHVIGERRQEEQAENTHFARIIVTGGKIISAKIPAYCDEVYHFNMKRAPSLNQEPQYAFVTKHIGDDFARTTLPLPTEVIFNDKNVYKDVLQPAMEKANQTITVTKL